MKTTNVAKKKLSIFLIFVFSCVSIVAPGNWAQADTLQELEQLKKQNEARQAQLNGQITGVSAAIKAASLRIDSIENYEIPKAQIELKALDEQKKRLEEEAPKLQARLEAATSDKERIEQQTDEMIAKMQDSKSAVASLAREELRGDFGSVSSITGLFMAEDSDAMIADLQEQDSLTRTTARLTNRYLDSSGVLQNRSARLSAVNDKIAQLKHQNEENQANTALAEQQSVQKLASIAALSAELAQRKQELEAQLGGLTKQRDVTDTEHARLEAEMNQAVQDAVNGGGGLPDLSGDLAFDPGYIIADGKFYVGGTMSTGQIQDFLNRQGANCWSNCLKDYRVTTVEGSATGGCDGYPGGRNLSAAEAISAVSQTCHISEKVLLVMLQKEQGLLTMNNPADWRYSHALGYACPDDGSCSAAYGGLYNQLYNAAWQFNYYRDHAMLYRYKPNMMNNIQYNPNASCGYQQVFIRNFATAGLYIYTPYVPNQAALNAGLGTGDGCSSYGNRNFYFLYLSWFGSTK
jgi:hypothetical protein